MTDQHDTFPGFPPEPVVNYWPYPKALNGWWHILTSSEQKVLDYILRHTWGYRKIADAIAISQFQNGITKRDGTVIDRGTGIKDKKTVRKALKGLCDKGFIERVNRTGREPIFKLKINPSQELAGVPKNDIAPLPNNGTPSPQELAPTIKDITIKNNNNNPAPQDSGKTYKKEIDYLIDYLANKLGTKFPNRGKQARYVKDILGAGFHVEAVCLTIDKMAANSWWMEHSFDMKNVADEIPKSVYKKKEEFKPCGKDGCEDGYILKEETKTYFKCKCRKEFESLKVSIQ